MELKNLPVLPLRGAVLFPHMGVNFDVARDFSANAVEAAMDSERLIFVTAQKNPDTEKPSIIELFKIGCVAKVKQTVKIPGGTLRVVAEGISRARLIEPLPGDKYLSAVVEVIEEKEEESDNLLLDEAFVRVVQDSFEGYFSYNKKLRPEAVMEAAQLGGIGVAADAVAGNAELKFEDKQEILEELDPYSRVEKLIGILNHETKVYEIIEGISEKVKKQLDKNQREYYLREEMHVIKKELGEDEESEAEQLRKKTAELKLDDEIQKKINKDIDRLELIPSTTPDSAVLRNYLDSVLELPWNTETEENDDLKHAEEVLGRDHYGLEKVKERILEHLAVRRLTHGGEGTVICLVGPPGTGKTSIAKSVADALGKKYARISLGGIHDEADIRGHRKTYIGAMPGRIMEAVRQAGTKNPLILMDEIDKMGADYKGDPSAALLEVLDTEQNHAFRDHYIEVPFDLSDVMFIMTANSVSTIPEPLLDRIELIELTGYTDEEKFEIAKRHLLPKQLEKNGLTAGKVHIGDDALREVIEYYTREAGVRNLEREIGSILRKAAKLIADGERKSVRISQKTVSKYLGKRKYLFDLMEEKDEVGIVRGLAWTRVGGETLSVEVNVMQGSGKVELTGKLGDVMKESALAAVSYVRSRTEQLKITPDFYKTKDIHIHVPEGAVPKDGPSAGITIATAVASALSNRAVRRDVAMTGEITLRGNVLPIGGLKEKSLAAHRAGITTVIIPKKNEPDVEDIPESVRDEMKFIPVSSMDQVLKNAFVKE